MAIEVNVSVQSPVGVVSLLPVRDENWLASADVGKNPAAATVKALLLAVGKLVHVAVSVCHWPTNDDKTGRPDTVKATEPESVATELPGSMVVTVALPS